MSIHTTKLATGASVDAFRLLSVRAMLRLEKLGMKNSHGAIRPRLAKKFGLSPRDSYDTYLAHIEKLLAVAKQEVAAENAAEFTKGDTNFEEK